MAVQSDRRSAQTVRSAEAVARSADAVKARADRATELAADRTVLASERTYAAWVRTGLGALASGVGARALLGHIVPGWLSLATGSVLVVFSAVCFVAAVWREFTPPMTAPEPDVRRLPRGLLFALNGFLVLVDLAVLVGMWTGPASR